MVFFKNSDFIITNASFAAILAKRVKSRSYIFHIMIVIDPVNDRSTYAGLIDAYMSSFLTVYG